MAAPATEAKRSGIEYTNSSIFHPNRANVAKTTFARSFSSLFLGKKAKKSNITPQNCFRNSNYIYIVIILCEATISREDGIDKQDRSYINALKQWAIRLRRKCDLVGDGEPQLQKK